MGLPFYSLKSFRGGVWMVLFSALCGCAPSLAVAPTPAASAAAGITEIRLESGCFGCATGSILVLRGDGTATYTLTGNARHGTQDQTSSARLLPEDFKALAQRLVTLGYFGLDESYEDPQLQDGAWTTTSMVRDGVDKRVFRRNQAGPPALSAVASAIADTQAKLRLVSDRR